MITNEGKTHIKRYMAGFVPNIAQSVAFGIGNKVESANDTKMHFEVGRSDISLYSYDFVNNRLVYKAQIPDTFSGTIYEAGIYSTLTNNAAGDFGSKVLVSFDSSSEDWVDPVSLVDATYASGNSRIGLDSLRHSPAASASKTDSMSQLALDLDGYSGSDKFVFAYYVGNTNTSSIRFSFRTDADNAYEFFLGAQTAGYQIAEFNKSTASVVGVPSWSNISELRVTTTSKSNGASLVDFDSIRIEDVDTINPDYILVAREALETPFIKEAGKIQEIEFTVSVNI